MKNLFRMTRLHLQAFSFLCSLLLSITNNQAQIVTDEKQKAEYEKKVAEELSKYELRDLKTTILLNKGIFAQQEVDLYRQPPRNDKKQIVIPTSAYEWQSLYERLGVAELRDKGQRIPEYGQFAEKDRKKLTKSNTISIGILNLDATLLTEDQLKENESLKKQNKNLKAETVNSYERIHFINASVLQEDVFQADVNFRLSPSLHISNNDVKIKQVELDFQDGKGYRSYPLSEKLIPYRFNAIGERLISIRLLTERGAFVFQSLINVKQLERVAPFREFEVTGAEVREDTITPPEKRRNGRMGIYFPKGTARIVLGCDQVFDKPIIIGEGIDLGNSFGLDDMEAFYRIQLQNFLEHGYDLVLLDYNDSRDYLENNAEVMKSLITYVYLNKVGTNSSIVIGESMSGLIARYTLRKMEQDGLDPHVSHFISYDSPHQGANLPVGITQIYWEARPTLFASIALLFSKGLRDLYKSLESPAATQMIRRWGGRFNVGVGNSHPEYQGFRNKLLALGNGGYPQTSRNIAMINGSLDASDRRLFNDFNYGSRILAGIVPLVLQSVQFLSYTNVPNNNSPIINFFAFGIIFNSLPGSSMNYQSPVNDDFVPGGRNPFSIPGWVRLFTPEFNFCFIPTYSAIDYSGPRDTQAQREFLNVNSVASSQTPFAAVYGINLNTRHVATDALVWNNLGTSENMYNASTACNSPNNITTPTINIGSLNCLSLKRSQTGEQPSLPFTVTTNATNGQYRHIWTAGGQSVVTISNSYTFYLNTPGAYTVSVTREFTNNPGVTRSATTVINVPNCDILYNTGNSCGWLEGDFVTQLVNGQNVFAHYANNVLYASTDNGSFVSRSTLAANGVFNEFADCFVVNDPRSGGVISLPNGCYTIKAKHSDKFMQPENSNNGARIRQYSGNGQSNQVFELEGVDSDAYKIKAWGTNRVWEAAGAGTGYQTAIQLLDYSGGNHQKWLISDWGDGTYRLAPKHEQTIIADVEGESQNDGAGLHLWGQHAGNNQRFYMSSVSCPGTTPNCNFSASTNPSTINTTTNASITLNASCSGGDCGSVNYQWSGNGASSSSSSYTLNAPGSNGSYTYTVTISKPGCSSTSSADVTVNVGSNPPGGGCSADNDQCSSNQNDVKSYVVNVASAGSYTLRVSYRSYEGPNGIIRWSVNDPNTANATGVNQTGVGNYEEADLGSASLVAGNNTVYLSSGALTQCFKRVCATGGGCTPPGAPVASANITTINSGDPVNLSTTGCSGSVTWENSSGTGNHTVYPTATTTYRATCTVNNCASGQSNPVTVTVNGTPPPPTLCAEAESSNGNGPITSDPNASNGQTRGGEFDYNHYVDYQVSVTNGGNYTLTLQYYASGTANVDITVTQGGNGSQSKSLPGTGTWNIVHTTATATVNLAAGSNTIRIQGTGGSSCRQDKVCVSGNGARLGVAEEVAAEKTELIVLPNPNDGEFEARFYVEPGRKATLRVSDVQGRQVWQKSLTGQGEHREIVRLPAQSVGSYILLLDKEATAASGKTEFKRVIVVK